MESCVESCVESSVGDLPCTRRLRRPLPALSELLLREALAHEPLAALSRAAAGVRGLCLIVNLPGRPRAVTQHMAALMPLLAHAILELAS